MGSKKYKFIWDQANTVKNWLKHQVRPFEAEQVFQGNATFIFEDEPHSELEQRWMIIGQTQKHRMLTIAFTMRNGRIRVISMRDANRREVQLYEKEISNSEI